MNEAARPFKWAYSPDANVKEPMDSLVQNGWQYGDVPTASNFNWLFFQIHKELKTISENLTRIKKENLEIKGRLSANEGTAIQAMGLGEANKNSMDWITGVSRQICRQLRYTEENIQKFHPNFPTQPWPLKDV